MILSKILIVHERISSAYDIFDERPGDEHADLFFLNDHAFT